MEEEIEIKEVSKGKTLIKRVGDRGIGGILMIIGVVVSLLSVLLSFLIPEMVGWYWYQQSNTWESDYYYLTGLGTYICKETIMCTDTVAIVGLIGGISVLIGSAVCIVAFLKNSKLIAILGGIILLIGPLLLIIEILTGIDYLNSILSGMHNLVFDSIVNNFSGRNINMVGLEERISWGVGNGFFVAIIGGALGLAGGVLILIQVKMRQNRTVLYIKDHNI
ncbi:MAG: hypothetical protein ACFFD7_12615 [Candidatus Thorarchaeota archaeon]